MIRFDAGEIAAVAADFDKIEAKLVPTMVDTFADGANDLRDLWRQNVAQSSGGYSVHYRAAITVERLISTGIVFEIGPDASMKQGRMAFELGDHNHPPHLDGQRATDQIAPLIAQRAVLTLGDLGL